MKVRKSYEHKNLVKELTEMCKTKHFVPDNLLVKKKSII